LSSVHSNQIIKFYGAVLEPKLCMVMEFCSRGSLYHVLNDSFIPVGWDRFFSFSLDIALGLRYLHALPENPIVHRDLKSLNVLANHDWRLKICDFGLSRFTNSKSWNQTHNKPCGTFAYCAPELFNGGSFTDKSDVFSMGIVLWEIIWRTITKKYQQPYKEYPNIMIDWQIISQSSAGLRPTLPESTPESLAKLYNKCVHGDHDKRPTASDVVWSLKESRKLHKINKTEWEDCINSCK